MNLIIIHDENEKKIEGRKINRNFVNKSLLLCDYYFQN